MSSNHTRCPRASDARTDVPRASPQDKKKGQPGDDWEDDELPDDLVIGKPVREEEAAEEEGGKKEKKPSKKDQKQAAKRAAFEAERDEVRARWAGRAPCLVAHARGARSHARTE